MSNPGRDEDDDFFNWPDNFDPEAFDVEAVNRELRKMLQ
jgi:hypothetical protein